MTGSRGTSWVESGMRHLSSGSCSCLLTLSNDWDDQALSQARLGSHAQGLEVRSRLAKPGREARGRTEAEAYFMAFTRGRGRRLQ